MNQPKKAAQPEPSPPERPPQQRGPRRKLAIKNKLRQPLAITLSGGKILTLEARDTAKITEKDLESPVLQQFIQQRKVIVFGH